MRFPCDIGSAHPVGSSGHCVVPQSISAAGTIPLPVLDTPWGTLLLWGEVWMGFLFHVVNTLSHAARRPELAPCEYCPQGYQPPVAPTLFPGWARGCVPRAAIPEPGPTRGPGAGMRGMHVAGMAYGGGFRKAGEASAPWGGAEQ